MSSIADKLREVVSISPHRGGSRSQSRDRSSENSRSESRERGRASNKEEEPYRSTGRGGAGNITRSKSPSGRELDSIDEIASMNSRGRPERDEHIGRGGAGNVRSPSRDPGSRERARKQEIEDQNIIAAHEAKQAETEQVLVTGRGGSGNIRGRSRSRPPTESRSSSRARTPGSAGPINESETTLAAHDKPHTDKPPVYSAGRGGAGNIFAKSPPAPEKPHHEAPHVAHVGRGGVGNTGQVGSEGPESTSSNVPSNNEPHHPHHSGRGGAGNITS